MNTDATLPFSSPAPAERRNIALVAHDKRKNDLLEWARYNRELLAQHHLCATATTGTLLELALDIRIEKLRSGPLGGDQQIGARIAAGEIDFVLFFWDPLEVQPHDADVRALLRLAVVWNIPVACNRASADFMISSPLMATPYKRKLPDWGAQTDEQPINASEHADCAPPNKADQPIDPSRSAKRPS